MEDSELSSGLPGGIPGRLNGGQEEVSGQSQDHVGQDDSGPVTRILFPWDLSLKLQTQQIQ